METKKRGAYLAIVILSILVVVLAGILAWNFMRTPKPERGELPDPVPGVTSSYVLTLIADRRQAILNGEDVTLSVAPVIRNNVFYYPLEDVVRLLGGSYERDGADVTIELFGNTMEYTLNSRSYRVNGEEFLADRRTGYFHWNGEPDPAEEAFVPLELDGVVFLPSSFRSSHDFESYNSLGYPQEYSDAGIVILGGWTRIRGSRRSSWRTIMTSCRNPFAPNSRQTDRLHRCWPIPSSSMSLRDLRCTSCV